MGIAITLCHETEHERRENKHDHSLFRRSKAESLPRFSQFEAPVPLQPTFRSQFLACSFCWKCLRKLNGVRFGKKSLVGGNEFPFHIRSAGSSSQLEKKHKKATKVLDIFVLIICGVSELPSQ
jgi:hypothetical protein